MSLINLGRTIITIAWFALFVAIWISAWSRSRRDAYTAAALLPLESSEPVPSRTEVPT